MRDLDAAELLAIAQRRIVARDLLWITAKNRSTGLPENYGYWNDVRTQTISVLDGRTGATVSRDFYGVGLSFEVGEINLIADISVRELEIKLPYLDQFVNQMIRTHDVRSAPIQIYRVYLDPDTRVAVATAKARFVGYVDTTPITTPSENREGEINLNCVSTTRELTRKNPAVRSHEDQLLRNVSDFFYKDTSVITDREIFWGKSSGSIIFGPNDHDRLRQE